MHTNPMPRARDAATIVENWSLTEWRFRHLERTVLGRYLLSCHTVNRDGNFKLAVSYFGTRGLHCDIRTRDVLQHFWPRKISSPLRKVYCEYFTKASWAYVVRYVTWFKNMFYVNGMFLNCSHKLFDWENSNRSKRNILGTALCVWSWVTWPYI